MTKVAKSPRFLGYSLGDGNFISFKSYQAVHYQAQLILLCRFLRAQDDSVVHVSHNVTAFEFFYEPFYVSLDSAPLYDERFQGYGFTRNTQAYEMWTAGWQFQVLSPAFALHWGLQDKKGRPSWRERQNSNNRRKFPHFKKEIFAKYNKDLKKESKKQVDGAQGAG